MNTNPKSKSSHPEFSRQLRDMTETGAQQSNEVLERIGTATSQAADVMKNCCSTALRGMQDYNAKLIEFTQENAKSHVEFLQKLAGVGVTRPAEFMALVNSHARDQLERVSNQAKELSELTKRVMLDTAEPVKTGLAKVSDRAA